MKYCGNCGKQIGDDDIFCQYCGAKTNNEVMRRTCPECGAEIEEGQMFCSNCGTFQAQDSKKTTVEVNNNTNRKEPPLIALKKRNVRGSVLLLVFAMFCVYCIVGIPLGIYGFKSINKAASAQTDVEAQAIISKALTVTFIGFMCCMLFFMVIAALS